MTYIDHPSQVPERYDWPLFLDMENRAIFPIDLIVPRRQMASEGTLGFSSAVFRNKFRAGMTVRNYRDNEVVLSQGDTADAVSYIQSGTVKLTVASTRRKNAIVAVLRGRFFGEGSLGGQSLRISTAIRRILE